MTDNALPLNLDATITDAVDTAFDSGNFITVAYNGSDGYPHVSRRGSVHVHGPQQLALWVRKRTDGLVAAIADRPQLTFLYMDFAGRGVLYTFYGTGRAVDDQAVADQVWAAVPEREKAQDPERQGIAVIVELQRIVAQGMAPANNFVMER